MYGYISPGGEVGQLFEEMPPEGVYHPDFISAIIELPDGVTSGWWRTENGFLPPEEAR